MRIFLLAALATILSSPPASAKGGASSAVFDEITLGVVYPPDTGEARRFLGADAQAFQIEVVHHYIHQLMMVIAEQWDTFAMRVFKSAGLRRPQRLF